MSPSPRGSALLTAYEPFLGRPQNQSQEVVRLAAAREDFPAACRVEFWPAILPQLEARGEQALAAAPRFWLAVGEAGEDGVPLLETVARNHFDLGEDAAAADGGPASGVLEPGGPEQVQAHWPAAALAEHLRSQGHQVELSQDAGAHCCNGVLWLATRRAAMSGAPRPWMGFLHLPRQPEQRPQQAALVQAAVAWLGAQLAFSPGAGRG